METKRRKREITNINPKAQSGAVGHVGRTGYEIVKGYFNSSKECPSIQTSIKELNAKEVLS